jgi:hypothetical protein
MCMVPIPTALEATGCASCCWVATSVHVLPLLLLLIVLGPARSLHRALHVHHLRLLHHVRCLLLPLRAADARLHQHNHLLLLLLLLMPLLLMLAAGRLPLSCRNSSS